MESETTQTETVEKVKATKSKKATIEPKAKAQFNWNGVDWGVLIAKGELEHWRTLRIVIQLREKLYAGKPKQLDAERAMIRARGLEDVLEAKEITDPVERAALADEIKDEGLCEFYRREGKPGIWIPSNQLKAMVKENWSCLGFNKKYLGTKNRLAECLFVFGPDKDDREWIYLGEQPDGIDQSVCHSTGPRGPISSIKRKEYVLRPRIEFILRIAKEVEEDLSPEILAKVLYHAGHHGVGADRSQGAGTFEVVSVEDCETWPK